MPSPWPSCWRPFWSQKTLPSAKKSARRKKRRKSYKKKTEWKKKKKRIPNLQEADEIRENQSVKFWQSVNYGDGSFGIGTVLNTILIKFIRDETLVKFTIPKFQ